MRRSATADAALTPHGRPLGSELGAARLAAGLLDAEAERTRQAAAERDVLFADELLPGVGGQSGRRAAAAGCRREASKTVDHAVGVSGIGGVPGVVPARVGCARRAGAAFVQCSTSRPGGRP